MRIKQLYNDNLRKLPNEYGDVSVMYVINTFVKRTPGHWQGPIKGNSESKIELEFKGPSQKKKRKKRKKKKHINLTVTVRDSVIL